MDYKQAYRRLRTLLDSSPDVICAIDKEKRFTEISKGSLQVLGYLPQELIGKHYMDFVVEEEKQKPNLEKFIPKELL